MESVQVKQTNNILYDKKHRYMLILKEVNALKNQIDEEVLNDGVPKVYAQEIKDIFTRIIVGLLEEGVTYQYVKDAKDKKKDLIRLFIDGAVYECKNMDIREILEDRYDEVMNTKYDGPSFKEIQQSRKKNEDKQGIQSDDVTNLLLGIKDAINDTNNKSNEEKQEKPVIQDYIPPKIYLSPDDEKKSKKGLRKFLKFIGSLVVTGAIIGLFILGLSKIPNLKEKIEKNWNDLINTTEETTTQETETTQIDSETTQK